MSEKLYEKSFSRNIGIFSEKEQEKLKRSTVAIAGVGGVGGITAERIARLGIGNLKIADPDIFEESNINRQFACTNQTVGQKKTKAVCDALKQINPLLNIEEYQDGVTSENIVDFLNGADLVIEEIEFFSFQERILVHQVARANQLNVLVAHSIGFGSPLFIFDPQGMSFEEFFELPTEQEKLLDYRIPIEKIVIKVPEYINQEMISKVLAGELNIPTVSMGCSLAASLLATETVLLLLKKRKPIFVPNCVFVDLFDLKIIKKDFSKS